jgi:hypothetical protein
LKQPSSIAAIAGKYEFEIMSGTASFIVYSLAAIPRSPRLLQEFALGQRAVFALRSVILTCDTAP